MAEQPRRSELLRAILAKNMFAQQPLTTATAGNAALLATLATAFAANKAGKQEQHADSVDSSNLALTLAKQFAPQTQITLDGLPGEQPTTTSVNSAPVTSTPQYNALKGMPKEALQTVLMNQMFGGGQDPKVVSEGGALVDPKTGKVIYENQKTSKEDDKFEIGNIAYPGGDPQAVIRAKGPDGKYAVFYPGSNGGPDFTRPVSPGYQWVSTSLNATEPGGLSSKQKDDLTGAREGAMNALGLSEMLRKQLTANPNIGLAGFVTQGADTINQQLKQFASMTGLSKEIAAVANPSKYAGLFEGFGPEAAKSQQFKTGITQLAIMNAIANNNGRAPTDGDVKREIASLAASSGSPQQIIAALDQMDAITRMKANTAYRVRKGEEPPTDWLPAPSGGGATGKAESLPGFDKLTPAEQAELKRLMGE